MAHWHCWTQSDSSARLVGEGLRRSEFAFIVFRDSPAGRQGCVQGSSLAVWGVMMLARNYQNKAGSGQTIFDGRSESAFAVESGEMLKLLLAEQISPQVGEDLRRRSQEVEICSLAEWEGGRFLRQADSLLLELAAEQGLTLETCDRKTIPHFSRPGQKPATTTAV